MVNSLLLAISSSIDSLGIGITYGIKNTKISKIGKIILFAISLITTYISILFGNIIQYILPKSFTNFLGCLILICMGIYICFQALKKEKDSQNIFNSPISSDINHSKIIEPQEALILAIALSLDSFCIGICGAITDINLNLFPFLVSILQLVFLSLGSYLGIYIRNFCKLPQNVWSIISGILLIFIGFLKFVAF
jgi:hypothetical protein